MVFLRTIIAAVLLFLGYTVAHLPEKRASSSAEAHTTFPASECGSSCVISWTPITTVLTVTPPAATVSRSDSPKSITVEFDPVTTTTTISVAPSTIINNNPSATPTLSVTMSMDLDPIQVQGSAYYMNTNNQQVPLHVVQDVEMFDEDIDDDDDLGLVEDGQPNQCSDFPYVRRSAQLPAAPFDFYGCSNEAQEYWTATFRDALYIMQNAGSLNAQSFAFQDYFPRAGYFSQFQQLGAVVQRLYDHNQLISGGKPWVKFVCVEQDNPWQPTDDVPDATDLFENALESCNGNSAVTRNWDRSDPDCLPEITLCDGLVRSGIFLGGRTAAEWCSVNFDTTDPDQDASIKTHFDSYAITLLHEATHVDAVAQQAGRNLGLGALGEGERETEIYPHSDCRGLASSFDSEAAEENAESHALAWTEYYFRGICGLQQQRGD